MENELQLLAVIGFKGTTIDGLILHPDNQHVIYPLGSQIIIRNLITRDQRFLRGHNNSITTLALSNSGKYIASGQQTFNGFKTDIIIWDFETGTLIHRLTIHKASIQSMSFSPNDKYLASLGGAEDNYLIIWDVESGKALCGNTAGTDFVYQVKFFNTCDDRIVTSQNYGIKIWKIDFHQKKLRPTDANLGNLKRHITSIAIDHNDRYAFFGTKTGDILEVDLENAIYKRLGPLKRLFSQGINCIKILPNNDLLIGTGEGLLARVGYSEFKIKNETKLLGAITSITPTADFAYFFCGTDQSNIYWVDSNSLNNEIRNTSHYDRINDVCFPFEYSEVFVTCSKNDIRIWNAKSRQELLRIQVPNVECFCIGFMQDGKSIYSGWHDGKIRAFLPQSGKLFYCINDAHQNGVTALTSTHDNTKLISGGMDGVIRIWKINKQSQVMVASLKEHRSRVWNIQINSTNDRAVSASADGSCIIWDILNYSRLACMFEATMFKQLAYHPDDSQIITTGSDRKISYWDAIDAQQLRMLDGSLDGEVNSLSISKTGEYFVSGGEDLQVKLWDYDQGQVKHIGYGHSTTINRVVIAPNQEFVVSVATDGSIYFWEVPYEVRLSKLS